MTKVKFATTSYDDGFDNIEEAIKIAEETLAHGGYKAGAKIFITQRVAVVEKGVVPMLITKLDVKEEIVQADLPENGTPLDVEKLLSEDAPVNGVSSTEVYKEVAVPSPLAGQADSILSQAATATFAETSESQPGEMAAVATEQPVIPAKNPYTGYWGSSY